MAKNDRLRPWKHRALAARLRLRIVLALTAIVAAAGMLHLPAGGTDRAQVPTYGTDFVALGAGPRDARAPLVRQPAKGVEVALGGSGYSVAREQAEVNIALAEATGSWRRHANGVSRRLPFGRETIVVDRGRTEQFLTVEQPQGKRTWRWRLDTNLKPESRVDGSIALIGPNGPAALRIAPAAIRDLAGREITPDAVDWKLDHDERGWLLSLELDDEELQLPYVIDPAVDYPSPLYFGSTASTITNSWRLVGTSPTPQNIVTDTVPAQNATGYYQFRPGLSTNAAGTPSATPTGRGWALDTAGGTGFPAGSWDFTIQVDIPNATFTAGSAHLVVGVWKGTISGGTFTSTGVLLDPSTAGAEGSSQLRPGSVNAVTVTDSFSLPQFSLAANERLYVELWRRQIGGINTGMTSRRQLDLLVNNGTARIVHPAADDAGPTGSLTSPGAVVRATATATASAADSGSGVASVLFERAPAGSGTWTSLGPADTSPPYSVSFDTTSPLLPDGLYDIRATMTDNAGNSSITTTVTRVDNSSPDQNPLTLTPLTGTANQYWDSTNSVLYYNSTSAGTFSLSSVPRDVSPPISFVGGNGGANNNSPLTLNVPAGVQAGDLLIAQVGYERTMATSVPTPAGWTRHVDRDNGTIYGQVIFYRWATASEPASYTIAHASGAASISGTLLAYRDVASVSPVLVNNGTVATGATLTAPSITTTAGCGRLVAFYGLWNTATLTTPTGMTQRATAINTEVDWNSRVLAADEILGGAGGATGTRVSTATVTDPNGTGPGSNVSELVALRPLACVSSVQYPTPGQTGFTGGGNTDTVEPYAASPDYSFGPTNTVSPGARTIVISDEAGNPVLNQTITFTRDVVAPVTTDDTGTITNAWRNVDTTVTLSPGDGTGAGLVQTYYTTNGVDPTTGSPTGTSILLTAEGTYTIKYFSTDRVANTEAVKTGAAQIRIDKTNPTSATLNALPAAIRNGQSLTGGGADALSGVGSITYLYCAGAACTPSTVVGSSSTPAGGYPVTWNGQPADGTYRVRARVFDAAGNQLDSAIQMVTIDNTNPAGAVTAPAAAANVRGATVSVTANSTDGGSGVANALFQRSPAGAGTWTTIGAADTSSPYGVTWDTTAVSDGLYDLRVVTTDNAGNTFTSTTTANVRVDNTNPAGAVTAPAAAANVRGATVSVTANSTDGGSGVANALFQRSPAGAGTWTTIGAADTSSPYGVTWDTTAVSDGLYDLRVVTTDNAGNTFTSTTTANVRVDNTVPTQGLTLTGVAPAGSAHLSGTNLFYRGTAAGQLRIRNTVADGGSGPASSTTSALGGTSTGWAHTAGTVSTPAGGPYDSNLFSWSAGTTSSPTVDLHATDAAGNNSATATLTLRNDTTAPTGGALTVNGVGASAGGTTSTSNGSFTIGVRTDWAETATPTASGLASSTLTRDSASYDNDACGSYSGSPTTIVGAPAQNLTVGCYRYVLTGTDNVGNAVSIQTDVLVHGAATQIALTGSTANLTSGATRVLTATVRDANGNTVVSDSSTVIDFAKQSGAGTVTGTGTTTASAGVATKTITGQLVGAVTMEATASGLTTGALGAFTVVHGAAAQIALTGSTANLASGATRVLTATIQDAAGNTVTSDNSTAVSFAKQSGTGTVSGTGIDFASNGVATATITGQLVGPVTMEATATGLTTGVLGSFTVVHGVAAQIALTGSTANLVSGAARVLTATIRDAAGNTVTSDNTTVVTFAKQSGAGTVTGTGTATAASGVATKTITGELVGPVVMQATATGLTTGTLASFTVAHGAAASIDLTGSTADLTSGATRVLTATLRDAAGNTVTSDNSTVVSFAKQSGAGTVSGTGTATAAGGVATKTITGELAGSVTMEATAAGLTTGALGAFTVVHGAAAQIELTGSTANLTSGATRVLTATLRDAAGNTVTADNTTVVTFAKQSGAGTVTGTGTATAASGVATKTITGALVGPVVMEATATGLTTGALGSFTVVHGAAAQIALTGSTANLTSGATRDLTATIQDAAGNTVTSDNTTVVTFAKASGAGTVTGTGTATATAGVATKTITGALTGPVVMEATATGLTTGVLGSFTIVHGAAATIDLTGSTADLTSGTTRVLTATIQDAAGNTVTSDNTTVVTFAKASGAGTVTGTGTATATAGVATKTITGGLVGPVTMEATAPGLTTGTLGAFTIVHGAAAQIALTGSTANLTSGVTRVLTATIQDAAGNTVTADNTTVVTFAKQSGTGTVSGTGTATAANGVATKTITGQLAGAVTMEATASGLTTGALGAFTVVHGAATQIALTGSTANLTSGATRVLTATIQDAAGNTVTADNSTAVSFAKQSGTGTVSGTGIDFASNGVATATITGQLAGPVVMEATATGLTTGVLGSFTVVHGAAAGLALTGSTASLTSGATRVLTATIRDAAGNTVTSDNTTVVTFAKQSGAGTVTGTGTATAASGVATKTITGALVGPVVMQATATGLTTGTLASFTVVHGAAASIDLTGSTANLTSGATRVLTATLRDAAGNTVTSDNSTVVGFAKASGAGTVSGTGTATAASGVATKTITGALVGSVTMEATAAGLTTGTLGAFTVVHGAAADIVLTGSTADLTSGATRVLTATIQDAAGNTVTSDNTTVIAFAKAAGAGTVSGTGTATAANGVATKTITGALAGTVVMEATAAGLTTGVLGTFTVVHGAAASIDLTGATADLTSGSNRVLTATIRDAAGNTVTSDSSTVVTFAKASGAGTVTGTGNATAASGVATKTITGALAGPVVMEATAAGLTTGTLGAFTVVHGAATQVAHTGATTDLASGATRVLTATIQDAAGNTVTSDSSTVVAFTKASGAGTVSGTGNSTAANGVATKTITGVLAGPVVMEATAAGLTTGTLGAFTVVHGAAADIVLTGSTADLASGANRVLTATLEDAAGNTVTSDSSTVIAFAQASGAGTVGGTGNSTAANGVATKTITGALAGPVVMEATAAGLTTGTLGAFTVVHAAAAQIALTGATTDLVSGASRVLTATVQDAAGNTITGDNSTSISFAQVGGAGTVTGLGGAEVVTAGVATKTVTGELAGSIDLEATAAGLTTGTLEFDVVHGAAYKVTISGSLTDLVSGTTRVLTATVRDVAGNRVASDNSTVVTFTKDSGAGTVTGLGADTAVAGVASKTVTGELAGAITILAGAPGLVADNISFDVVHGSAASIDLTGSTADLASGANRVLTATIRDAAGNTVTSDSSTVVAFAKASGAGTVSGTGTATATNGVATKTTTGQLAGLVVMEATAAGLTTGTLGAFAVVHGAAASIDLTGSTADLASGANRVLTATIMDAAGNTVTGDSSTVVTFAKQSGAGTVTGTGTSTASSGVATKTVTGALAGSVTMEATAAGLTTGTLGSFTVVHGAASQIDLTHSGSTASGDNHTLTATIRDAAGNTVTADSSTVVAFAKTGGAGTVTGLGNATAAGGVATKIVVNGASGQIDVDAQAAGLTTGATSYTIVAGNASTLTSTISASPTSIVANGSSTSAITVRLKDAAGNDLSGSGGTVALGLTGAGSLSAVTDNGDGTYSATLTSPTAVGSATVTGTLNAAALAATAGVTYVHGPATRITLTESGSTVAGNAHTLTATIEDANGNTVTSDSSTVVAFAKTGGAGTVTGLGNATASNGVATRNVTNMLAGQIDLDAQASGLSAGTTSYTIATGPVSAAASDSTVVAAPGAVYANGTDTATITVTLRDAGGNGVAGKTVTLAQGGGGSTITGGGATNAFGVVTFSASNASVETVTYTATDTTDSITLADDATVDFTFQDATAPTNTVTLSGATRAWLSGTTLYYNGAAGGSFALSSAVADGGAGPASAAYPMVAQAGWTHGAETVTTPAGGPYLSGTYTFGAGTTGDFTHDVTAADAWTPPNTIVTTLNVTEDSTAPTASILCNAAACSAGWYVAAPVSVTLAAPDAGAGLDQIRYTTDGTDPTILTGTVYSGAFDVAAEGGTTVKYRAFDRIGNDTGVQTQLVRIDTVAPGTTIDSAPDAATQDTTPTFAFSSAEAGSTFQVRLDGGSWTTETSPLTLGPLAENTYTFEVRATDVAGNVDATPASFTFTVDTTAANTTITSSPPVASSSTSASFSFTASDAGPGFECRLDGGAFADCSSPASYSGLTEAAHTFEVRAEDAAGNLDATPATHAWTVDLTAPNTSFLSTPANPSANPTPTFGLGSTESPSTFECDLDGGGWSACSTPFTTPVLGNGSHTLQARATDAAGNTDASEITFTWLVDATAPTGSITSPADGADVGGTVVLASDSADAGGSGVATVVFQRSPAGLGGWTSQAASWDTTAVADGDYDLRVVTTDGAGNSFTSGVITVTVDNTDPSLTVVAPNPVNLATADPATVSATAGDGGSGIANVRFDQCAEDSPACVSDSWVLLGLDTGAPYEASWPIPSDGPRLLRVRATDNAGKQKTELVLITVDRTRPSGSLAAPSAGANLRGASVSLAATASDAAPGSVNTVTFQRSPAGAGTWSDVDVDSSAPYTASLDTTSLADGLYDLRVFTTDAAGNAEATPATIQVRVDNTDPTGSITAPADAADLRGTVALTSSSADGGSGVDTVVFQRSPAGAGTWTTQAASWDTTLQADGQYDLRVVTTDNAGNAFISPAITVRVDNTNPTGAVTAPAAGANVRATVALTSDSADGGSGVATVQFQRSPAGAGTWTNQAASWNTTLQADGQYDLRVVTTDNAGNAFTSGAITVRVDNTDPTGSVSAPLNGAEIGIPPVALTSNSADSGSGVATVVFERSPAGAGSWTATPASWDTATGADAVADGDYDLRVTTTDNAGNPFTSAAITVKVDHTAPTTSASLAPGSPSNSPVTVTFTAGDGTGSGVSATSYSIDGGPVQTGNSAIVAAPGDHSNDGSHVVQYFSTDDVGNVETPQTVTVVIDTTAPSGAPGDPGTYLRGIANLTYSTGAADVSSVQFQFSPAGAGAWSNIGAADISPPYDAAWNTTLVADGPYDLRAVVTDTTGNVANELLPGLPKTVDNTAPAGSVTSPAAASVVSGTVNVTATASDGAVPPASGVSAVRFEIKPSGAGTFSVFGTQNAPVVGTTYQQSLVTSGHPDGPAEIRVVVTDVAGNETTSAVRTITLDNDAPVITLDDPGAATSGTATLGVTTSADTAQVVFEYSPAGAGSWTTIATDATPGDGFTADFDTTAVADGLYDVRARATDVGGNPGTSAPRTTRVDNTQPTGSITAPGAGATVGGPAVQLTAAAADGGSGVVSVAFEVKPFGAGAFALAGTDTGAPYTVNWDSTSAPDGVAEIRALVTDAAGNVHTTAVISVTVDSTGPSVTLADPGAVVSGTVALSAATSGGATRVAFAVAPAGSGTWTPLADDASAPFAADLDTTALADGLYDLRAIGYDLLDNASTASVRANVRFDNTAPTLVSSAPADGSVSVSANQIVLTASEPVTTPGSLLDGAAAPAPGVSGNQLTFATGALAEGLHVLAGELVDASGNRTPFRVAVTIESTPQADRPPVEKSASPTGTTTLEAPGQLATVSLPATAWPTIPGPKDFLVLHVDPILPTAALAPRLATGTNVIEVTARWALAGTNVHAFDDVLEVLLPATAGSNGVPVTSQDGTTWRTLASLDGATLPAGQADGFYRDAAGVHVLTRHLSYFAFFGDAEPPTPPTHVAGVVADDGLTLRWLPGTDNSGQLGKVVLLVNGESYATFEPTQYEVKLGAFAAGDTRIFSFLQYDAAGNVSEQSQALRAVPSLVGLGTDAAAAALAAAGFSLGSVDRTIAAGAAPGTIVAPAKLLLATVGSPIDVTASMGGPQTKFVLRIANDKRVKVRVGKLSWIPVRIFSTRPATGTATLATATGRRLYTWRFKVAAGVTITKLRLPSQVRRPGFYRLTWNARSGAETARTAGRIRFVGPGLEQLRTRPHRVEVVLAVDMSRGAKTISSSADRVVSHATPERTFALLSARDRTVRVVVVDVDRFGIQFLRDVRTVFPTVRAIALSDRRVLRPAIERAGAFSVLPRSATQGQLLRAIRRASVGLPQR